MPRSFIIPIGIILSLVIATTYAGPGATAPQKKKTAVKQKTAKGPAPVPLKRVMADFSLAYRAPDGLATVRTQYLGAVRNAIETRGENRIPVQFHTVVVTGRLSECGLRMKNTWESRYYRLETEWIFQDITLKKSEPAGKPASKLPPLDDNMARQLISGGVASRYGTPVQEVTILGKKGSWNLCVPTYLVTAKVVVSKKNEIANTLASYECLLVTTIIREKGSWFFVTAGCVYKEKNVPDCHIETMCRTLSLENTIPPISDDEALRLLQQSFEAEYGLKKNNIFVEKFSLTRRLPAENDGTSIPCLMNAVFVIDEYRETPASGGSPRTAEKVRAVYECSVSGTLRYSLRTRRWEGVIGSCCSPGTEGCGRSCSAPYKGCGRLGEK